MTMPAKNDRCPFCGTRRDDCVDRWVCRACRREEPIPPEQQRRIPRPGPALTKVAMMMAAIGVDTSAVFR